MAVTFDSWTINQPAASSFSVTIPSLTNGACAGTIDGTSSAVTAATFGGVSATILDTGTTNGSTPSVSFIVVGVPSGSQTVSLTGGGNYAGVTLLTWYLNGVDQTTPVNASHYQASSETNSMNTTNSCWIIGSSRDGNPASSSPLSTARGTGQPLTAVDANGMVSPATPFSNVWTGSSGYNFLVAINQVLVVGPTNVKTWDAVTQSTGIKTYKGVALASVKTVDGLS
jgi:hypothetical protein